MTNLYHVYVWYSEFNVFVYLSLLQPDDVSNIAIEKINALLESFMGINDTELCKYIVYLDSNHIIISPNEVFGDIMVLASPPHLPPPVDPDDVNTLTWKVFNGSLSNFMRVYTPEVLCYWNLILRKLEQRSSQPNNMCIPKIFKMQYLHKNGPIAIKLYTEVKYLKLHNKIVND